MVKSLKKIAVVSLMVAVPGFVFAQTAQTGAAATSDVKKAEASTHVLKGNKPIHHESAMSKGDAKGMDRGMVKHKKATSNSPGSNTGSTTPSQ